MTSYSGFLTLSCCWVNLGEPIDANLSVFQMSMMLKIPIHTKKILFSHSLTLIFFENIPNLSFVETLPDFTNPTLVGKETHAPAEYIFYHS